MKLLIFFNSKLEWSLCIEEIGTIGYSDCPKLVTFKKLVIKYNMWNSHKKKKKGFLAF